MDIKVDWHAANALPPIKRVPTAYSPTPALESYAETLNRVSQCAGVVPRTGCDFCMRPFPRSGQVPALRVLTVTFTVGDTKTVTGGPWYLCDSCKAALDLKEGDGSVPLSKLRRYYREQILPRLREALVQQYGEQAVPKVQITADLHGPG